MTHTDRMKTQFKVLFLLLITISFTLLLVPHAPSAIAHDKVKLDFLAHTEPGHIKPEGTGSKLQRLDSATLESPKLFCASCSPLASAAITTLNLKDFGAVGDNVADDGPALQRALDALAAAGGGTLIVPSGRYAISTPVAKNFTGLASSVKILGVESSTPVDPTGGGNELSRGLDLVSEFFPKTGPTQYAIRISGLQTLLIKDIAFVGTPGVLVDALITLVIEQVEEATVRHCEFYGVSNMNSGGAIVIAVQSYLKIEQSKFLGCEGNSGVYAPIVQNYRWKGISVSDTVFIDYGQRPELYGKMVAAPISWINIGNAEAVTPDSPRREVIIRNVFLDEGGYVGIYSLPQLFTPPSAKVDLIYISDLKMNVSNFYMHGHLLEDTRGVLIEKSRYQWSTKATSAVYLGKVGTAILDQLECLVGANTIQATARTEKLYVVNSVYSFLDSAAQSTEVRTTDLDDDPVQYVRQQYQTLLRREPEPAGHFYWSELMLRCGEHAQCVAARRADLNAYLGTSPSPLFSITGVVTDEDGKALPGIEVALSGAQTVMAQTDVNGRYRFSKLPTSGSYQATVGQRQHYIFDSPSQSFTTPNGDRTANFTARRVRYSVSGRVDVGGVPKRNVTVTVTGSQSGTAITDSNGAYSFVLRAGDDYTITPSLTHHTFTALNFKVSNLSSNQVFDFTAKLNAGVPILISRADSTRAIALDSVLQMGEPFQPRYLFPWATDNRTRLMLFAMNFELSANEANSAVTANAQDASGRNYPLIVENVSKVPGFEWLNSIVVRLNDEMGRVGDVLVSISYRGISSNRVRVGIGQVGGGPPDDPDSVPTPGRAPQ